MIITFPWLKEHLKTNANENEIINKLTNIGLEVESVKENSGELSEFKIAKIIKSEKHPKIEIIKEGTNRYLFQDIDNIKAIISDKKINTDLKQFKKNEIDNIVNFILNKL